MELGKYNKSKITILIGPYGKYIKYKIKIIKFLKKINIHLMKMIRTIEK